MTRRDWVLTLVTGLCSGLIPSCTHTIQERAQEARAREVSRLKPVPVQTLPHGGEPLAQATVKGTISPYHTLNTLPPKKIEVTSSNLEETARSAPEHSDIWPLNATQTAPLAQLTITDVPETGQVSKSAKDPPLLAAMRCYLEKRPADAALILTRYEKADQDMLQELFSVAARFGDERKDPSREAAASIEHLNNMVAQLRSRAPLVIEKMSFCRRIDNFGIYEPMPEDHAFKPEELVRLYVELRNFTSERRELVPGRAVYVTQLASAAEIHDYSGKQVWSQEFHRARPDQSQTLRHDYFDHYRLCLPELPPGPYTLCLKVTELSTQRTARRSLDFQMTSVPPK